MANNKLPQKGWEGINSPLLREQIKAYQKCCRVHCFDRGKWLPVLLIRLEGQMVEEETVKFPIPILLCDKHREECTASDILQQRTKDLLTMAIKNQRKKSPNWDTVSFDWREVGPKLPSAKLV